MKADAPNVGTATDWRLDYLFSIGISSWLIHLGVVTLTFVVLYEGGAAADRSWAAVWFAGMLVLSLALAGLSLAYRRNWLPGVPARWFGASHSLATALAGLAWGAGAIACALRANSPRNRLYGFKGNLGGRKRAGIREEFKSRARSKIFFYISDLCWLCWEAAANASR